MSENIPDQKIDDLKEEVEETHLISEKEEQEIKEIADGVLAAAKVVSKEANKVKILEEALRKKKREAGEGDDEAEKDVQEAEAANAA